MGLPDTVIKKLENEVGLRSKCEQELNDLQMEVDLCHTWLDAADIPRMSGHARNPKKKTLLQRIAIFSSIWISIDKENYAIFMENIDKLVENPNENNLHFTSLNHEALKEMKEN